VRSIYADWERGDFSSAAWADPAIEFVLPDGPSPGSWRGIAEMSAAWREVLSAWRHFRVEAERYRDLGDGRVLVLTFNNSGRGRTSGLEVGQFRTEGANVFQIRNGRVTRLVSYLNRDQALADLGLEG
jgi:ketosteroid isomerase-like protein